MRLFLLRHGIAEDGIGMADSQRQLTPEGRKKLKRVLRSAAEAGLRPDVIVTSPYVRARQTAAIAVEELQYAGPVVESALLTPEASPHAAWDDLRAYRHVDQVLVTGHNPHLSNLVCLLLGARTGAVEMHKAGIACLDLVSAGPEPRATLNWLMTPKSAGA
jgi:phosphohistidine phosphatase